MKTDVGWIRTSNWAVGLGALGPYALATTRGFISPCVYQLRHHIQKAPNTGTGLVSALPPLP